MIFSFVIYAANIFDLTDQVANDTASTPAENLSHNGSNGNVGFEEMVLPVIPSASPVWTPEPPQQAISNEASTSSAGTSQSPAPVALNGMSFVVFLLLLPKNREFY